MSQDAPDWIRRLRGRFLVFDGPDGGGKTTLVRRFAQCVKQAGLSVCEVREPGGTAIGEQIRQILLDPSFEAMDLSCEMLLYMASRAQLVAEQIRPALGRGELVLADRFVSSTLAYQGAAGGIDVSQIRRIGQIALGNCWPDLVVILDVDEKTTASRLLGGSKRTRRVESMQSLFADRMELKGREFQDRVRQGYLAQVKDDPLRHLLIDATADIETVYQRLLDVVAKAVSSRF